MKNHNDYLDNISVAPELHEKIMERISQEPKANAYKKVALRYAGMAACAAVALLAVWAIPGFFGNQPLAENINESVAYELENPQDDYPQEDPRPVAPSAREDGVPRFTPTTPEPRIFTAISIHPVEAAPLIEPQWDAPDPAAIIAARGANDFAFNLAAALVGDIGNDNFVVSPYSVWMPLAALLNATAPEHQPALLEALGAVGITPEDVNRAASRMLFDLTNERARRGNWGAWGASEDSSLHIANAIFVDHRETLLHDFAQTFMDYFRGEMISVDFRSPDAVDEINQWASDNTHGLIDNVVQEFDPDTVAAIANAIFFSGTWSNQFDPSQTRQDVFHSPAGESHAYFMQREWSAIPYFEDTRVQAINLPLSGESGMKIILPRDGDAAGLLADMTSTYFNRMFDDAVYARGRLELPRFSIENTLDSLEDALIALGVPLFDELKAPLTGLLENPLPAFLGCAVQVARIEVDEEGTTAAAVTVMSVRLFRGAMLMPPYIFFEMICNHPFVFVLHSPTQDGGRQVLFTGVVNQP